MSKTDKMRGRLASIQKDREEFERQKKELEADMHIGRNNMRNINRGLRNNAILEEPIVVEAGAHGHHSSKPTHSSTRIIGNNDNHGNSNGLSVGTASSVTPKEGAPTATSSSSSANASGHFFGASGANASGSGAPVSMTGSIMPSGPRVSDWCYSAPLDSPAPPTVKSRELYENVRLLGRGSFGEVNLAKNTEDNKLFAIKTQLCPKDSDFHNVLREVRFLRACRHPCIIDVHDAFLMTNPRIVFIVMHYCEAGTISSVISSARKNKANLAENQVIKWVLQLGLAMQFLHDNFVVHRDLKPMNVMLTEGGDQLKLADFGLAMSMAEKSESENTDEAGTPYYTAPEMIMQEPYSYPADCWSFGVIVHQLLALDRPFDGSSTAELVKSILSGEIPPLPAHYSDDIKLISAELLRKDQTERLTMSELLLEPIFHSKLISFPSNYRPRVLEERIRRSHQKQLEVQIEALNRARKTDGGPRTIHEKILLRQQAAEAKAAEEAAIAAAAAEVEASNNSNTHSGSNSANMSGCGGDGTPRRSRLPSMSHAENADFNSGAGGATGTSTRNGTPSSRQHQQTGPPSSSSPFPRNHSADLGGGDDGAGGDTTASNPSAVGTADFEGGNDAELMTSRSETQKMSSTKSSIAAGGGGGGSGGTGGSSSSRQSSGRLNSAPTGDATTTDVSGINSSLGAQSNSRSLMALAEEDSTKSAGFVGALLGSASVKAQHSSSALLRRESEGSTSTADATAVSIPVPAPTEGSGADVTSERQASAHLETHQDHQDISEMTQQTISSEDEKNHMSESGAEEKKKEEETPTEASGSEERRVIFEMSEEASLSAVDISGMSTIASSPMKSERLKASPTSSDTVSKPSTPLGGRKGQELAKAKESDSYYEAQLSEKPLMLLAEEEATSASNPDNSLQESALLQVSDSVEAEMPLPTTA